MPIFPIFSFFYSSLSFFQFWVGAFIRLCPLNTPLNVNIKLSGAWLQGSWSCQDYWGGEDCQLLKVISEIHFFLHFLYKAMCMAYLFSLLSVLTFNISLYWVSQKYAHIFLFWIIQENVCLLLTHSVWVWAIFLYLDNGAMLLLFVFSNLINFMSTKNIFSRTLHKPGFLRL